jgi:DNA-binding IclR family transcriptional regulator
VTRTDGTYRTSLRFLDFGEFAKQNIDFYDVVNEEVQALAERTGEVAHFMVEEHGWGVHIYKERDSSGVQTALLKMRYGV